MKRHGSDMLWKAGTYNMNKLGEKEKKDETKETQEEELRQAFLHTSMLIHTNMPHTQLWFYTQILYRTNTFTHNRFLRTKHCYTQTLFHTDAFTQMLLRRDSFTHKHFYTQTRLHAKHFTHKLFLHTNTFTHNPFTHKHFYTQALLHTGPFAHNDIYTETLLHTNASNWRYAYSEQNSSSFDGAKKPSLGIATLRQQQPRTQHFCSKDQINQMAGSTGWGFCLTAKKQLFPTFKSGLQSTAVPPCLGVPVALQAGGRENCMEREIYKQFPNIAVHPLENAVVPTVNQWVCWIQFLHHSFEFAVLVATCLVTLCTELIFVHRACV